MESPRTALSILVVEDEAITLESLVVTLARKYPDVTIHKADNGRTALELFKTHRPDIVVTDINMPEISGIQLAVKIRELKPDTKFIVLTGDTGKLTLEDSIGNGFKINHYIEKPVDFWDLFAAIEQCLGEIEQQS
jgi:YesN/AraC family two-component response regulator